MTHFAKNNGCSSCGDKKADCHASPAVLQINNPSECVIFHKTVIPASMGDETTIPPVNGAYKNMLVYYEGSGAVYLYSSDGIPTLINYTDYVRLTNKPSVNGITLIGNKTLEELGIPPSPTVFTMQYDVSDVSAMPGWQSVGLKEKIGETYGTPVEFYKTTYAYYETDAQHPVTFLNEETGDVITPAELYSLLTDGEDVTINHVPIVRAAIEWGSSAAYIDGVHLTKVVEPAPPYDSISFCGSVYATVSVPVGDDWETIQTQLGFSIEGWAENGSLEYGMMTVRGVEQGS